MHYQGSCHCGRIAYEVEGEIDQGVECNCSHCSRKGYCLWFVSREQVRLHTPPSAMSTYTFNRHVIEHHFCPVCACSPFGFGRTAEGRETAAINLRCLEDFDLARVPRVQVDRRSS